jgi:arsenate reductase-like glutaredoxin family protein
VSAVTFTIQDIRDVHLCARGAREWFAAHNLDFRDFLQNGMNVERIEAIDDHFAQMVAQHVRNKHNEVNDGR